MEGEGAFTEGEVCYCGESWFVRILCASRNHMVDYIELVLESRGMLENLSRML